MPTVMVPTKGDLEKWKNIVQTLGTMAGLAETEHRAMQNFFDGRLESAEFWKKYAFERTSDAPLRQIAQNDLDIVRHSDDIAESIVPGFIKQLADFLSQFEFESKE